MKIFCAFVLRRCRCLSGGNSFRCDLMSDLPAAHTQPVNMLLLHVLNLEQIYLKSSHTHTHSVKLEAFAAWLWVLDHAWRSGIHSREPWITRLLFVKAWRVLQANYSPSSFLQRCVCRSPHSPTAVLLIISSGTYCRVTRSILITHSFSISPSPCCHS